MPASRGGPGRFPLEIRRKAESRGPGFKWWPTVAGCIFQIDKARLKPRGCNSWTSPESARNKDQDLLHRPEVYATAVGNQDILHAIVEPLQRRRRRRSVSIVGSLVTLPETASL
jgi:hypothetical protein